VEGFDGFDYDEEKGKAVVRSEDATYCIQRHIIPLQVREVGQPLHGMTKSQTLVLRVYPR
jgi:hypothetical protein